MRRLIALAVLLGVSLAGAGSFAQEATVTEEAKPLSGFKGGFFIRTDDDQFELKIKGRLQFMHRYEILRGAPDINTFHLRRSRLIFVAKLFKDFEVVTFVNHSTNASGTTNTPGWWAWATYQPIPEFAVQFGHVQLPLDRGGEGSSGSMAMTEAPLTATQDDGQKGKTIARQSLGLPMTLGVRLQGDVKRFHYMVGLGNGEDRNNFNLSKSFAYSGRFAFDILGDPGYDEFDLEYSEKPKLQVGVGSGFEGQDATDAHINNVTLNWSWTSSADVAFKWRGLTLISEWYLRKLKVRTGNFTLDDVGYYAHAGYFVIPKKLELVARGAQIFREGPDNNAYEFGGGINWYIRGNNVKLQTDFNRLLDYDDQEGQGHTPYNRFRTMLTINI